MTEEMSCTGGSTDKIIREHFNTVYRLALAQAGNVSIAEDITQDVFLRFIQSNTEFVSQWYISVHPGSHQISPSEAGGGPHDLPQQRTILCHNTQ